MQPKIIIRCRHVHCGKNMVINGPKVKVAVCNGLESTNYLFQKKVQMLLDSFRIPGTVKVYENVNVLLEEMESQDIIFYLLNASPMDELEQIRELKKKHKNSKFIFVAENGEYLKESYRAQPFRYLYLSDPVEDIQEAIFSAIRDNRERQGITLEENGKYYYILLKDILYIEALGDEIGIFTIDGHEYIIRMPLKQMFLLTENEFIRCNRQQIVNARYIQSLDKEGALLVNNEEVTISGRKRKNVVEQYAEYMFRMKL